MTFAPKHLRNGSNCPLLKENQLRLYSMRFSPYAQRTKLVLAAKGIEYEVVNVNLFDLPDWYLQKNEKGETPTLEWIDPTTKETRRLFESLIISDYIDEAYPEHRLHSIDPYIKAKQRILVERFVNVTNAFYKAMQKQDLDESIAELKKQLNVYEQALSETFFGGSSPGMTDYMLWPWFDLIPLLKDSGFELKSDGQFPRLVRWIDAMENNKIVKDLKVAHEIIKKFIVTRAAGAPDYDIQ